MSVGKDTIQTLLRQRQTLRQALQELQKDIASLNITASDLVANNIKSPTKPLPVLGSTSSENTVGSVPNLSETNHGESIDSTEPNRETTRKKKDIEEDKAPGSISQKHIAPTLAAHSTPKDTRSDAHSIVSDLAYMSLLQEAKQLSGYYLRHPSPVAELPLKQLDDAISTAESKAEKGESKKEYQALRNAYRNVAGKSFSITGINGRTLEDSLLSAHILWILPMIICALTLVISPLLLLGRTVALEMFTAGFAADLIWIFGVAAAFLWGMAGALTLLSLQIAVLVKNLRYEAKIRRSPGIRAVLGGILGCGIYALLQIWFPHSNVTIEFFQSLGAFAMGLVAWVIFLSIQKGLGKLIGHVEPDYVPSSANIEGEK